MNKYYGIIISLIAGMSTIFGFFLIYMKGEKNKIISKTLSFAGGVMIMLSIIDLLPSSISNLFVENGYYLSFLISFIFFWIGFLLSYFIEKICYREDELYKTGIMSMFGIILHNIPEGIATYVLSSIDLKLGIFLAIAIILHNIPEGVGISIPIYHSTKSKKHAFMYTFISGISEPFGAFLAMVFLHKYINSTVIGILFSIISGLMIYIGYYELIKTSKNYDKNSVLNFCFIGMLFILIVEIILKL